MDSKFFYHGEECDSLPEYGVDGVDRYAVEVVPNNDLNIYYCEHYDWGSNAGWLFASGDNKYPHTRRDVLPADTIPNPYGEGRIRFPSRTVRDADDLWNITESGRRIAVPLVGGINYGADQADIRVGKWADVVSNDEVLIGEAYLYWEDLERHCPDLYKQSRRSMFEWALGELCNECKNLERYIREGFYDAILIDIITGETVDVFGPTVGERAAIEDGIEMAADYEAAWEEEYAG